MSLNYFDMMENYESRKVANDVVGGAVIDTAAVPDSTEPFETAISSPNYNDGNWVIVELYRTKQAAREGHARWVTLMAGKPASLTDVSMSGIKALGKMVGMYRAPEDNTFLRKEGDA